MMNEKECQEMAIMENTLMQWNLQKMQKVRINKIKENYNISH